MEDSKSGGRGGRGGRGRNSFRSQNRRQPRGDAPADEAAASSPVDPSSDNRGKRRRGGRGRGDSGASHSRSHTRAGQQDADEAADNLRHKKTASGDGGDIPSPVDPGQPPLTEPVPQDTPRFGDLLGSTAVDPIIVNTITEDLKFDHMMPVQAATLHELLPPKRSDCLVQAKTGTGKTVAFLLPALQTLIQRSQGAAADGGGSRVSLLVISPTRELAQQIAKEANNLLQRMRKFRVCVAIGGTNKDQEERKIRAGCEVLIATPGRLLDHMSSEEVLYSFRALDTLVLDEADRLLDMGFKRDLTEIVHKLPNKEKTNRQGMLFSATIAPHVTQVANLVLSPGYKFISTIPEGEANTHQRVPQILLKVDRFSDVTAALVDAIRAEMPRHPGAFKAIVFAPTAALADLYGHVLSRVSSGLPPVLTLHSRMSQSKRTKITNDYRDGSTAILCATDVIARGMDFPGVTTVFQVGIPSDKESYIHRLGRTARAGAEGRGIFIVSEGEMWFPKFTLKDINFIDPEPAMLSKPTTADEVQDIVIKMEDEEKGKVYQAWLGYYKNHMKPMRWDREQLVQQGNIYAKDGLGAAETPSIAKSTVSKMGLKGTRGLVVVPDPQRHPGQRRGGGGGRTPRGKSA